MKHRHIILLPVALLLAPLAALHAVEPAKPQTKPNIVYILGAYLDKLAGILDRDASALVPVM